MKYIREANKKLRLLTGEISVLFKPWDALVYMLVLLIMTTGFVYFHYAFTNNDARTAIIEMDGRIINTVRLEQNMELKEIRVDAGDGKFNIILIGYDYVEVLESNCPDQVCVRWGRIRYSGQSIVCLPFRIVIRIAGQMTDAITDDITW